MKLIINALFLCAFCIINTNAMFYKDENNKCAAITDNNMIAYDLQVVSCVFVEISEIEATGNTLKFIMKNPELPGLFRMELNKTEQMLINPDTPITFARRGRGDNRDHWNNEETKKLGDFVPEFKNFTLYHNYDNRAAIALYQMGSHMIVVMYKILHNFFFLLKRVCIFFSLALGWTNGTVFIQQTIAIKMKLITNALFLCAFCIINTNAMFYKDKNNKCGAITDNNMIVYDLQVISCVFVEISEIEATDNTLRFIMKNPELPGRFRMELTKTEQMLINPDTPITFARRGRGDDRDHWNNEETKKLGDFVPEFKNFTLYHNYDNRAAIALYRMGSRMIVEGNIGGMLLRYIQDFHNDEILYAYAQIASLDRTALQREFYLDPYTQEYYNLGSNLERVHINILPVIDGRILNYGIVPPQDLLRPIFLYYHYIDMLFGIFSNPVISFTIKKMIVSAGDKFMPYVDDEDSVDTTIYMSDVNRGVMDMVNNQALEFGLTSNDIVIFMAGRRVFDDVSVSDGAIPSMTFFKHSICEVTNHPLVMFSLYSEFHNDYLLWHLISKFATTNSIKYQLQRCSEFPEEYTRMQGRLRTYLPWMSRCIADMMTHYFMTHDCSAFNRNKPRSH
ncbi:uncharacterized protein LOC130674998 [Microplitis mediator]|uniref:uncharacterized protein LOC130674998 n=1 Tax=Microplitis mediator TaxID=375433 RepID=UPI002552813A|nr:uncharacterized protein LOC130674998 [Microplitis mediator]